MVKKRVKFLYFFEGALVLMTISMILLLVGCTKGDPGTDDPTSVIKGEKIQQESAVQTQETAGEENSAKIPIQEEVSKEESVSNVEAAEEKNSSNTEAAGEENVSNTEASATDEKAYYGHWKIVDFLAPGITALSIDEMEGYIDVQLTYAEDSFTVDDARLETPIYSETVVTKEEFADGFNNQVTFDSLNISGDFVTDVSISNSAAFGSMFYAADAETLYITLDGAFFKAERQPE